MAEWKDFVNFEAATDTSDDMQNVEGPRFLKYFPFPENLPGRNTLPKFNFYNYDSLAKLNKEIQSGTDVEPESMTSKLKYLIAREKIDVGVKSAQERIVSLYNSGIKLNNWIPFYEYYFNVTNEIASQLKLFLSLQQLFDRRSSMKQDSFKEEKEQSFNPIWDEVRFRLKGGSNITDFMKEINKTMLSPNKNPPPPFAEIRAAVNLCETSDNSELINQYLSWPYIDFNEVPCGSLNAWSDYTSFRFKNLLEKNDQSERSLKTIATNSSAETELIRSLFIRPLSSLYESAGVDECVVDSPIERFNALAKNSAVQWYAEIIDNKPRGVRLTHFSNVKHYLHYCMVKMGNNDNAGFFGWLQILYFLGCDVVYSLQDLTTQVKDKLEIYLEEHEGDKSAVDPVIDYLDAVEARLDDFLEFWVNRMRTQYGLLPPVGKEKDPEWKMGFRQFGMVGMHGGADDAFLDINSQRSGRKGNKGRGRKGDRKGDRRQDFGERNQQSKEKSVVMAIPCYMVCHVTEGTKIWPLEHVPEAIIMTAKDTKSSFAGLVTTPTIKSYTSANQMKVSSSSPLGAVSGNLQQVLMTPEEIKAELINLKKQLGNIDQNKISNFDNLLYEFWVIDMYVVPFVILQHVLTESVDKLLTEYNSLYAKKQASKRNEKEENKFKTNFDNLRDVIEQFIEHFDSVYENEKDENIIRIPTELVKNIQKVVGIIKPSLLNYTTPIYQSANFGQMVGGKTDRRRKNPSNPQRGNTGPKPNKETGDIDFRSVEGRFIKMERSQKAAELYRAERMEYPFTQVTQEVSNKVESIYWLSEFKNSAKFDPRRLDGISFKWWTGSTRTIENTPIYLGGAGVRIEGESSFDCAIPFVQLACYYMIEQKDKIKKLLKAVKDTVYLTGSPIGVPQQDDLKRNVMMAYHFLSTAYKEFIGITKMISQKRDVPQRSYILYNANLMSALHLQWSVVAQVNKITLPKANNEAKLWEFIKNTQEQYNNSITNMAEMSKVSYLSFTEPVVQEITNVMNVIVGSSNMGVVSSASSSSTGVSLTTSATGYKSKYDFKIISPANEATIVSDQYWNQLVSSLNSKKIWLPYTRDSGSSMSVDYVLDLLQIANDAQMLVRSGRGINFSAIMNNSAYSRRVVNNSEFINTIKAGFVMVAMNSTGKTSPEAWRRTNATLLRKYIVNRMRQINQSDTDTPRDVFTVQHLRMVIFEILTNNIAYTTLTNAAWNTRVSKLKARLVQDCSGDMAGCPFITTREGVAKFMSSKGRALSGFDWQSGMMAFRARLTQTQRVVGEIQGNKTGIAKLLSS